VWDLSKRDEQEGIRVLEGHTDSVFSVLFHPNNPNILVSCSLDGTIRVWDLSNQDGREIRVLRGHTEGVVSVIFHPANPNILVSGSLDGTIRVWDLSKQEEVKVLEGHADSVESVLFHPNNPNILVSWSLDGTIRVWDLFKQEAVRVLKGHANRIISVIFHPKDSNILISGSWDGTIRLWDLSKRDRQEEIWKLEYEAMVYSLVFPHVRCNGYETKDMKDRVEFLQKNGKECGVEELLVKFGDLNGKLKASVVRLLLYKN